MTRTLLKEWLCLQWNKTDLEELGISTRTVLEQYDNEARDVEAASAQLITNFLRIVQNSQVVGT